MSDHIPPAPGSIDDPPVRLATIRMRVASVPAGSKGADWAYADDGAFLLGLLDAGLAALRTAKVHTEDLAAGIAELATERDDRARDFRRLAGGRYPDAERHHSPDRALLAAALLPDLVATATGGPSFTVRNEHRPHDLTEGQRWAVENFLEQAPRVLVGLVAELTRALDEAEAGAAEDAGKPRPPRSTEPLATRIAHLSEMRCRAERRAETYRKALIDIADESHDPGAVACAGAAMGLGEPDEAEMTAILARAPTGPAFTPQDMGRYARAKGRPRPTAGGAHFDAVREGWDEEDRRRAPDPAQSAKWREDGRVWREAGVERAHAVDCVPDLYMADVLAGWDEEDARLAAEVHTPECDAQSADEGADGTDCICPDLPAVGTRLRDVTDEQLGALPVGSEFVDIEDEPVEREGWAYTKRDDGAWRAPLGGSPTGLLDMRGASDFSVRYRLTRIGPARADEAAPAIFLRVADCEDDGAPDAAGETGGVA